MDSAIFPQIMTGCFNTHANHFHLFSCITSYPHQFPPQILTPLMPHHILSTSSYHGTLPSSNPPSHTTPSVSSPSSLPLLLFHDSSFHYRQSKPCANIKEGIVFILHTSVGEGLQSIWEWITPAGWWFRQQHLENFHRNCSKVITAPCQRVKYVHNFMPCQHQNLMKSSGNPVDLCQISLTLKLLAILLPWRR